MGDKVEELHQSPTAGEKDIDESAKAALPDAPAGEDATAPVLNESSASCSGQDYEDDTLNEEGERRVLSAQHNYEDEGLFWKTMRVIFFIPLKVLSLFGLNFWQTNLRVSGIAEIDKSPLRPASTSPQKRKRDEQELSSDEGEDVARQLLEDDEDYDSQDDKDFKPDGDESTCSDEFAEGDTTAELSTLSVEDVSEPRKSALRNLTEVDLKDETVAKAKAKEDEVKKTVPVKEVDGIKAAKCIEDPLSKPEITPATVGVMG